MSKTVLSVLAVGAAVAAVAVGQPQIAGAIIQAGLSTGSAFLVSAAATLAAGVSTLAISAGLAGALQLSGAVPSAPKPQSTVSTLKPPRYAASDDEDEDYFTIADGMLGRSTVDALFEPLRRAPVYRLAL